jgi:hypothetical protein
MMIISLSIIRTVLIHMAVGEASGIIYAKSLWKVTRHEIPLLNSTSSIKGKQVCNKLVVS